MNLVNVILTFEMTMHSFNYCGNGTHCNRPIYFPYILPFSTTFTDYKFTVISVTIRDPFSIPPLFLKRSRAGQLV